MSQKQNLSLREVFLLTIGKDRNKLQTDTPPTSTAYGYVFAPVQRPSHPGHTSLTATLRAHPTLEHFDPEQVRFQAITETGLQQLHIHHPWGFAKNYRVCAGLFYLFDRHNKSVETFTFGGSLQIHCQADETTCIFTSPAPCFELINQRTLATLFADEVEILLAQERADWATHHDRTFEQHLAGCEPFALYVTCLQALRAKFAHYPHGHDLVLYQLTHFLDNECAALQEQGKMPLYLPTLTELLHHADLNKEEL